MILKRKSPDVLLVECSDKEEISQVTKVLSEFFLNDVGVLQSLTISIGFIVSEGPCPVRVQGKSDDILQLDHFQ